jgi:hypothetical protein
LTVSFRFHYYCFWGLINIHDCTSF